MVKHTQTIRRQIARVKTFFVTIIKRCLSSLQMAFKSFFWLVCSPNTQKKRNLTWVNMWLGSSLTFSLYIFLLGLPRHPNLGGQKRGPSQTQNAETRGVLTIDLSCFYFKRFIARDRWTGMTDILGQERGFLWHTHTHARTHT